MIVDVCDIGLKNIDFTTPFDPIRQRRARGIYNSKSIEILSVDKEELSNKNYYNVSARVVGNYVYMVNLEIENTMLKKYSCTCPDANEGCKCKHILATCMEILDPHKPSTEKKKDEMRKAQEKLKKERQKKRIYNETYYDGLRLLNNYSEDMLTFNVSKNENTLDINNIYADTIIEDYSKMKNDATLDENIIIEPRIVELGNDCLKVSFKIGTKMMYSLKEINNFATAFKNKKILNLGKKLNFVADAKNFDEKSQKILKLILDGAKDIENYINLKEYYSSSYYSYRESINYNKLLFIGDRLDSFFETLKDENIVVDEKYGQSNGRYEISDKALDVKVTVTSNSEENFAISLVPKVKVLVYSNDYLYLLYNGVIYKNKYDYELRKLMFLFDEKDKILIPKDKLKDFENKVLPKISKFFDETKEQIFLDNNNNPIYSRLGTKIFLDLDDSGNIKLVLNFCYGDKEFNVLEKEYEKCVTSNNIQRNINEEREVLYKLFRDGFSLLDNCNYMLMIDEDKIYEFLTNKIEDYMSNFEVLVSEKFKNRKIRRPKISNISVSIENGLLNVDMSKIDLDFNEIQDILKDYKIKKKYYKLKSGDLLDLSSSNDLDFLSDISTNLDIKFDKIKDKKISLPPSRTFYLEKLLDSNENIKVEKNDDYNKIVSNVENRNFSDNIEVSDTFKNVLRPYQETGYKWLKVLSNYGFGGILADDMGLGKTLQVIAILENEMKSKVKTTSIVVSPSSLTLNWKSEIEKWCKKINVQIVSGNAEVRKELIKNCYNHDLIITSYDLLKRDIDEYEKLKFKYVIADEAQYIKNSNTQNATSVKSLKAESKFALTGTPVENSVSELWSIFDFIMPGYLYNYNKFKTKFEKPILVENDQNAMKNLKKMIEPFILRRIKKDVLTELPDKNITVLKSEMTSEQQKLYFSYMAQVKKDVAEQVNENGFEKSKFKILMLLTRLRQICCHPSLFIENYGGGSGKLDQCIDILSEAIDSGHKILLFSQYTSMFDILEERLKKMDIKYFKLTGETVVDKRIAMVDEFNKNSEIKIFLISLKAGGTGLNLTGADVVIHYDPWWNLSAENQATDRAYRIGQKNSVQVYKLIANNSIEERINELQEKKSKLSEELLSTEETFINKLSKQEIMSLFE